MQQNSTKILLIQKLLYEIDANKSKEKIPSDISNIIQLYSDRYDVDSFLVTAVIKAENNLKTFLFSINNPGCVLSESSNYRKPQVYDNLNDGIHHLCKMLKLVRDYEKVYNADDLSKLLRPTEPAWCEQVEMYYKKLNKMYRSC